MRTKLVRIIRKLKARKSYYPLLQIDSDYDYPHQSKRYYQQSIVRKGELWKQKTTKFLLGRFTFLLFQEKSFWPQKESIGLSL